MGHPPLTPNKGLSRKGTTPLKVGWMGEGKTPKNKQLSGKEKKEHFISLLLLPPSVRICRLEGGIQRTWRSEP